MKYCIGGLFFTSKKAIKDNTRKLIRELGICKIDVDNNAFKYFMDLINLHPNKDEKIGCGIKAFIIRRHPTLKNEFETSILRIDDTEEVFSHSKCIDAKTTTFGDLNACMRNAIEKDIQHFRINQKLVCKICNANEGDFEIDHIYPFCNIRDDFIKEYGTSPTRFDKNKLHRLVFLEEDNDYRDKWIEYHNRIAKFQVLCKKCNRLKSNKL